MDSLATLGVLPESARPPQAEEAGPLGFAEGGWRYTAPPRAPNKAGANSFTWNLRYPEPVAFTGMILWAAGVFGPVAPPGSYTVRLSVGDTTESQTRQLLKDRRSSASQAHLDDQINRLMQHPDQCRGA